MRARRSATRADERRAARARRALIVDGMGQAALRDDAMRGGAMLKIFSTRALTAVLSHCFFAVFRHVHVGFATIIFFDPPADFSRRGHCRSKYAFTAVYRFVAFLCRPLRYRQVEVVADRPRWQAYQ